MADAREDLPELATNEDWRGIMKRARGAHKMTQGELAAAVRRLLKSDEPSQAMISKIESGAASSSKFVMPVCRVLSIPPPEHFVDELDRAWVQAGRVMRSQGLEKFKRWLASTEDMIGSEPAAEPKPDPEPETRKRPRAVPAVRK